MRIVSADELEAVWPRVLPWIDAAVKHGQGDEDAVDIGVAIYHGRYDLWLHDKFAAVVQVVRYQKQTVLTILYIGGEMKSILPLFEFAKAWCKENGVHVLRTYGRPGWERVTELKRVGVILQESIQ